MRRFAKDNAKLVTVAAVCLTVGLSAPAMAATVVSYAKNADKVDGKHAVAAGASVANRKGRLVATSGTTGRLPDNIIAKAPDAAKLDGKAATAYVHDVSVVWGTPVTIAAVGGYGTATVTCPTGVVLSGNYSQSDGVPSIDVFRSLITGDGKTFSVDGQNVSGSTDRTFRAYAVCSG